MSEADLVFGEEKMVLKDLSYPVNINFEMGGFSSPIYEGHISCGYWDKTKTSEKTTGSFVSTSKSMVDPEHFKLAFGDSSDNFVNLYKIQLSSVIVPGFSTDGCEKLMFGSSIICRCTHLTEIAPIILPPPTKSFIADVKLYPNTPLSATQMAKGKLNVFDLKIPRVWNQTVAFIFMIAYSVLVISCMIKPLFSLCDSKPLEITDHLLFYYPYISEIFRRKILKSHMKLLENLNNMNDLDDDDQLMKPSSDGKKKSKVEINFENIKKLYSNENLVPDDLKADILPQNVNFAEIIDLMANRAKVKEMKGNEDLYLLRMQNDRLEEENKKKEIAERALQNRKNIMEANPNRKAEGSEAEKEVIRQLERELYRAKMKVKAAESRLDILNKNDITGMRKFYKNPFFEGVGPVSGVVRRDNVDLRREFKDADEQN
jgi:hypothetical protein